MKKGITYNKDGTIQDFVVPDAHTLYVCVANGEGKDILKEAITLWSLDDLDELHTMKDKRDGYILGQKWLLTPDVITSLKSKGEATQTIFSPNLNYRYWIVKTRFADNLRHKG